MAAIEDKLPGGQDVSWDLMDGIGGKESQWTWNFLGRKKLLCPLGKAKSEWIDGELFNGINDYYHLINTYVLEGISRDPGHIVQRMVRYVVPGIWQVPYLIAYDRKGRLYLYRQMTYRPAGDEGVPFTSAMTFLDMERKHCTFYCQGKCLVDNGITTDF